MLVGETYIDYMIRPYFAYLKKSFVRLLQIHARSLEFWRPVKNRGADIWISLGQIHSIRFFPT